MPTFKYSFKTLVRGQIRQHAKLSASVFVLAVAFASIVFLPLPTTAQTQGRITGRVADATGAVIVNSTVTIENRATGVKHILQTNGTGDYVALNVNPGGYSVSAEASGFRKVVRENVQVEVGGDLKIDFELPTGSTAEVVRVTGEAPMVDANTTTLSGFYLTRPSMSYPYREGTFKISLRFIRGYSAIREVVSIL